MFFTIGLPVTKVGFLKNTIDSILNQSFSDFEVIIQNNALLPEDRKKIAGVVETYLVDNRFRYYENDTLLPIYDNFNKILSRSTGQYFMILSDDDNLTPDSLSNFYRLITSMPGLYVYHCRVKLINEKDEVTGYSPLCNNFETLSDFVYQRLTVKRQQFLSDFVVDTAKLKSIGGFPTFPLGWGMDDLTWYLLGENGIGYTSDIGLEYRVVTNNFSNSKQNFRLRLDDINFLYNQVADISTSDAFIGNSVYPSSMVKKAVDKAKNKAYSYLFKLMAKGCSSFYMIRFYLKNKREHNIPYTALFYGLFNKIYKF
ncbi:glycosyltransferase family A protein [Mucilaginibacter gossypii]|uniref:glycosyltransferase family 2 protein n=1 Tax=Mucilaginibacter gossypii TaxID=551996 RepID=UPI000DCDD630|nr:MULTISPECIES: glycosyltransferase family A protein [Mucilaginibacter]QTE40255.1 glycosyltransferase family A protein [Mucilaginibacter gossypii]RAV57538.1 glycosyl transferase family 2 [Mucilaginibacter rubeus]